MDVLSFRQNNNLANAEFAFLTFPPTSPVAAQSVHKSNHLSTVHSSRYTQPPTICPLLAYRLRQSAELYTLFF